MKGNLIKHGEHSIQDLLIVPSVAARRLNVQLASPMCGRIRAITGVCAFWIRAGLGLALPTFDKKATFDLEDRMRLISKPLRLSLFALLTAVFLTQTVWAHHGWGWATDEEFELTGEITAVRLGNPHGEVTLDVKGEKWIVEVGQPWRNEKAGLTQKLLSKGQVITAHGHRSARNGQRLMKAERFVINGRSYNLYPDRQS